jgi:hypothetical protein
MNATPSALILTERPRFRLREAMHSTNWRYCAVGIVECVGRSLGAQQQARPRSLACDAAGHHYDLPATLITRRQIEAHKKEHDRRQDDDVPMNMVKAVAAATSTRSASAS